MTREEAIKIFNTVLFFGKCDCPKEEIEECLKMAIKALEQEPILDRDCEHCSKTYGTLGCCTTVSNKWVYSCKEGQREYLLDKIRAEIETKYGQCDICEYFEDYDYEENDISEYRPIGNIVDILQIIDKYKAESENV